VPIGAETPRRFTVKVHEPAYVRALGAELAVEGLDEGVVGGLAGSAEVENDALLIGPEIKALEMNSEP